MIFYKKLMSNKGRWGMLFKKMLSNDKGTAAAARNLRINVYEEEIHPAYSRDVLVRAEVLAGHNIRTADVRHWFDIKLPSKENLEGSFLQAAYHFAKLTDSGPEDSLKAFDHFITRFLAEPQKEAALKEARQQEPGLDSSQEAAFLKSLYDRHSAGEKIGYPKTVKLFKYLDECFKILFGSDEKVRTLYAAFLNRAAQPKEGRPYSEKAWERSKAGLTETLNAAAERAKELAVKTQEADVKQNPFLKEAYALVNDLRALGLRDEQLFDKFQKVLLEKLPSVFGFDTGYLWVEGKRELDLPINNLKKDKKLDTFLNGIYKKELLPKTDLMKRAEGFGPLLASLNKANDTLIIPCAAPTSGALYGFLTLFAEGSAFSEQDIKKAEKLAGTFFMILQEVVGLIYLGNVSTQVNGIEI